MTTTPSKTRRDAHPPRTVEEILRDLRHLSSPLAETLSDGQRVTQFIHLFNELETALTSHRSSIIGEVKIDENTSDGYHTFKELYEFRKLYNAALFNEWANAGKYNVHKSKRHYDGEECFGGGWFIVMADLPTGQISNHYELKDWDLFNCEERERGDKWDGHTAQDVAHRLDTLIRKITTHEV